MLSNGLLCAARRCGWAGAACGAERGRQSVASSPLIRIEGAAPGAKERLQRVGASLRVFVCARWRRERLPIRAALSLRPRASSARSRSAPPGGQQEGTGRLLASLFPSRSTSSRSLACPSADSAPISRSLPSCPSSQASPLPLSALAPPLLHLSTQASLRRACPIPSYSPTPRAATMATSLHFGPEWMRKAPAKQQSASSGTATPGAAPAAARSESPSGRAPAPTALPGVPGGSAAARRNPSLGNLSAMGSLGSVQSPGAVTSPGAFSFAAAAAGGAAAAGASSAASTPGVGASATSPAAAPDDGAGKDAASALSRERLLSLYSSDARTALAAGAGAPKSPLLGAEAGAMPSSVAAPVSKKKVCLQLDASDAFADCCSKVLCWRSGSRLGASPDGRPRLSRHQRPASRPECARLLGRQDGRRPSGPLPARQRHGRRHYGRRRQPSFADDPTRALRGHSGWRAVGRGAACAQATGQREWHRW
jgi:hypothetical protein